MLNQDLLEFHCNTIEDMERLNFFCKLRAFEKNKEKLIYPPFNNFIDSLFSKIDSRIFIFLN